MYSKNTKSIAKNQIDLSQAFVSLTKDQHKGSIKRLKKGQVDLNFYIFTPHKHYKFKALTMLDQKRWVEAIEMLTVKNDKKGIEDQFQ